LEENNKENQNQNKWKGFTHHFIAKKLNNILNKKRSSRNDFKNEHKKDLSETQINQSVI